MLSSVLRSKRAVEVNIEIMRAFVRLRRILASHADLALKLAALEEKYDGQFRVVFEAIRQLMAPPEPNSRKIGFHVKEGKGSYRATGKKRGGRRSGSTDGGQEAGGREEAQNEGLRIYAPWIVSR